MSLRGPGNGQADPDRPLATSARTDDIAPAPRATDRAVAFPSGRERMTVVVGEPAAVALRFTMPHRAAGPCLIEDMQDAVELLSATPGAPAPGRRA